VLPSVVQAGTLGPSKASQLVTLGTSGASCLSGLRKVDTRLNGDGTSAPFIIPPGMVLVITGAEWFTFDLPGLGSGTEPFNINLEGAGTATVHVTGGQFGVEGEGGSTTFSSGIVVKPGTNICARLGSGNSPFPVIHGFLAKDS